MERTVVATVTRNRRPASPPSVSVLLLSKAGSKGVISRRLSWLEKMLARTEQSKTYDAPNASR
jgi:hypothetical protein